MSKKHQCQICLEECSCKKTIHCGFCDFTGCKNCVKESILYSVNEPECPKCRHAWSYEFCIENINRTFMEKDYRKRRKDILFDIQKSKIPETMSKVENEIKIEDLAEKSTALKVVINDLREQLNEYENLLYVTTKEKKHLQSKSNNLNITFKKKCPKEGCAGFLSTRYKCPICETKVCQHCNEILSSHTSGSGGGESKQKEHVCNPDMVASCKMIKDETKPCPNCATAIFKIDGCDQMWCTSCHVAFSWKTGQKVTGRIHNPHFYQWKQNNNDNNREVGEILCGGVIDINIIHRMARHSQALIDFYGPNYNLMSYCKKDSGKVLQIPIFKDAYSQYRFLNHLSVLHREITHFQATVLDKYRRRCNEQDGLLNSRISFIRGKTSEKAFKSQIIRNDTMNRKSQLILNILEMFYVTFLETYNDMCETLHRKIGGLRKPNKDDKKSYWQINRRRFIKIRDKILSSIERMVKLLNYSNKELWKISKIYNQTVPIINFPNVVNKKYNDKDFQCYAVDGVSQMAGKIKLVKLGGFLQEKYFDNSKWFNNEMGIYKWDNNANKEMYTPLLSLILMSEIEELNNKAKNVSITNKRIIQRGGIRV